jgi:hypothetical protein
MVYVFAIFIAMVCANCAKVAMRDVDRTQFEIFQSLAWCLFYSVAVIVCAPMCPGWQKAVPAPTQVIPKKQQGKAIHLDYVSAIVIAMVRTSFQVFIHLYAMSLCPPPYLLNLDVPLHLRLNLNCAATPICEKVVKRNICHMELESFHALVWRLSYPAAVIDCSAHMSLGPAEGGACTGHGDPEAAPRQVHPVGYVFAIFIANFPVFMSFSSLSADLFFTHTSFLEG